MHLCTYVSEEGGDREGTGEGGDTKVGASPLELPSLDTHRREVTGAQGVKGESRNVTRKHVDTQMSVLPKYEQDCRSLDTVVTDVQASPKQPRSNGDLKYLNYYTFQQIPRGGRPQTCSTMHALRSGTEKAMDSTVRRARRCRMVRHPITGWNLLMARADRLDGGTGTSEVSQRSESGQGILSPKEGSGMWLWMWSCRHGCRPGAWEDVTTMCHPSS